MYDIIYSRIACVCQRGIGFNKWMDASTSVAADRWSDDVFTHWFNFSFNFLSHSHTNTHSLWLYSPYYTQTMVHFTLWLKRTVNNLWHWHLNRWMQSSAAQSLYNAMGVCLWCEQISTIHERLLYVWLKIENKFGACFSQLGNRIGANCIWVLFTGCFSYETQMELSNSSSVLQESHLNIAFLLTMAFLPNVLSFIRCATHHIYNMQ